MPASTTSSYSLARAAGQAIAYAAFAAALGYFATSPPWRSLGADQAVIKLSVHHATQPVHECRRRSPEELAKLPPNMRLPLDCPRERSPLHVQLDIDGVSRVDATVNPPGWRRDSATSLYRRLAVAAGEHRILARLNDSVLDPSWKWRGEQTVRLVPGQVLVVQFDPNAGFGFK